MNALSGFCEMARKWRAQNAAKVELRQFTPPPSVEGVDELAQSHSTEAELAHELARNWRNWRGAVVLVFLAIQPIPNPGTFLPHTPPIVAERIAGA